MVATADRAGMDPVDTDQAADSPVIQRAGLRADRVAVTEKEKNPTTRRNVVGFFFAQASRLHRHVVGGGGAKATA